MDQKQQLYLIGSSIGEHSSRDQTGLPTHIWSLGRVLAGVLVSAECRLMTPELVRLPMPGRETQNKNNQLFLSPSKKGEESIGSH